MKSLQFLGTSLNALKSFPDDVRRMAGFELRMLQQNLEPRDWKPMEGIGPGVKELRLHSGGEWRIISIARFADAVYGHL